MLSSKLTTPISHFFRYDNFIDKDNMGNTMNDFKIINELGKGSYGVVYKVKSNKDDQIYVVKKIELKNLKPKNKKEAFQEVQLLRQLNHHHMIKYYNSFIENNSLFIVMEYAEGGDLQQVHYILLYLFILYFKINEQKKTKIKQNIYYIILNFL